MPKVTKMPPPDGRIGHLKAFRNDLLATHHTYSAQPAPDLAPEERAHTGIPKGYEDIAQKILEAVTLGLVRVGDELERLGVGL